MESTGSKPRKSARIKELEQKIDPARVVALLQELFGISKAPPSFEDQKLFRRIVKLFPRSVIVSSVELKPTVPSPPIKPIPKIKTAPTRREKLYQVEKNLKTKGKNFNEVVYTLKLTFSFF